MRGVCSRGEAAGAHEEGPHEVGEGRLPDLLAAFAARWKAVDVQGVLHEGSVQGLRLGSTQARHEGLSVLPGTPVKDG